MQNMDGWDVALLAVAGYVAATALVRLMIRRRNRMIEQIRVQIEEERKRREAEEKRKRFEQADRREAA
jgi:uncharacterized OsmC-like protein